MEQHAEERPEALVAALGRPAAPKLTATSPLVLLTPVSFSVLMIFVLFKPLLGKQLCELNGSLASTP